MLKKKLTPVKSKSNKRKLSDDEEDSGSEELDLDDYNDDEDLDNDSDQDSSSDVDDVDDDVDDRNKQNNVNKKTNKVDLKVGSKKRELNNSSDAPTKNKKQKISDDIKDVNTLFVFYGNRKIAENEIKNLFEKNNINVSKITRNHRKSFCYVDLTDVSQIEDALKLHGKKIGESVVKIEKAIKSDIQKKLNKKQRYKILNDNFDCSLHIKNLAYSVTKDQLEKLFPLARKIILPLSNDNKLKSKGYAFAVFQMESVAEKVSEEMNNCIVEGRAIQVSKLLPRTDMMKKKKEKTSLLIKQLNFNVTKERLLKVFKNSINARIIMNTETQRSAGYGFVEFETEEATTKAFEKNQGKELEGRVMVISYAVKKKFSTKKKDGNEDKANRKSKNKMGKKPKSDGEKMDLSPPIKSSPVKEFKMKKSKPANLMKKALKNK